MKHRILLFAFFLLTATAMQATIRTVYNFPSTVAQYNTIQAAINASSSGDTIYVHASTAEYNSFTITDKQLVLIGSGWAPDKNLPLPTKSVGFQISGILSSGTEIQGFTFRNNGTVSGVTTPSNLRFIRNNFNGAFSLLLNQSGAIYAGYLFEGNIFNEAMINGAISCIYQNFLFQNNIFYRSGASNYSILKISTGLNFQFNHNLWYGTGLCTQDCANLLFSNNIFVGRNAAGNSTACSFNNNITFNAVENKPWAVNGNVDGGSNIENIDPQMVDQAAVNAGTLNGLLNFTIPAGPADNSASDGKDMGLLYDASGSLNWDASRTSRLPVIYNIIVSNPTVSVGDNLQVTVVAKRNN